jgi:hypothetical protein
MRADRPLVLERRTSLWHRLWFSQNFVQKRHQFNDVIDLVHDVRLETPNENKMSDGGRERALPGVEVWNSSQKRSVGCGPPLAPSHGLGVFGLPWVVIGWF